MDLLAPCRTCLQCLPFFHDSPPPSPRPLLPPAPPSPPPAAVAAAEAEEEENPEAQLEEKHSEETVEEAAVIDPSSTDEKSSPSDAPLPLQHQDLLPLSEDYTELGSSVSHATIGPEGAIEEEAAAAPCIIIAPPVTTHDGYSSPVDTETTKITVPYELPLHLPFINDIEFSTAGLMTNPSPVTPAPFGPAYLAGQQHPHPQIYHELHHDHAHPNHHFPPPHPPMEGSQSDHGYHHDNTHHYPPHSHDTPPHPPLESDHEHHDHAHNHHPHEHDTPPHPPLEISQSADVKKPHGKNGGTFEVTITNGSSGLLETSQSEPIVLTGASDDDEDGKEAEYTAVRRRDKLKH